jgi:hypothetical protein
LRRTRAWGTAVFVVVVAASITITTVAAANDEPAAPASGPTTAPTTSAPVATTTRRPPSTTSTTSTTTTTTTVPKTPTVVAVATPPTPPTLLAVRNVIDVTALDARPAPCPDGSSANPCFGIQQNLTIRPGNYFVQNVYMIRKRGGAYEAMGGYWVWDFDRSCGSTHMDCLLARNKTGFQPISLPARLELTTAVVGNELHFGNTFGALPAFALGSGRSIGYDPKAGAARMNPDVVVVGMAQGDTIDFTNTTGQVSVQLQIRDSPAFVAPRTYCLLPDTRYTHTLEDARGLNWGVTNAGAGTVAFGTASFAGSIRGAGVKVTPYAQDC